MQEESRRLRTGKTLEVHAWLRPSLSRKMPDWVQTEVTGISPSFSEKCVATNLIKILTGKRGYQTHHSSNKKAADARKHAINEIALLPDIDKPWGCLTVSRRLERWKQDGRRHPVAMAARKSYLTPASGSGTELSLSAIAAALVEFWLQEKVVRGDQNSPDHTLSP